MTKSVLLTLKLPHHISNDISEEIEETKPRLMQQP